MWRKSDFNGSYGAIRGAATAMTTIAAAMHPQNAESGERRAKLASARSARRHGRASAGDTAG